MRMLSASRRWPADFAETNALQAPPTIFQTLNSGWTEQVFEDCHAALTTKTLYDTQAATEMAHTAILTYVARPGAVIFQLVHCILQNFPFNCSR